MEELVGQPKHQQAQALAVDFALLIEVAERVRTRLSLPE